MQLIGKIVMFLFTLIPGLIFIILGIDLFIDKIKEIVSRGFELFDLCWLLFTFFLVIGGLSVIGFGISLFYLEF